jgi:hypothetical protein
MKARQKPLKKDDMADDFRRESMTFKFHPTIIAEICFT